MAADKFPLIAEEADVTGTALSKVTQLQPGDRLSPDALPVMGGDTGSGGTAGVVPAPVAGDANKVLSGAGTWVSQSGGGGLGDVTGPGSSTTGTIPKWADASGDVLTDGVAAPSGAIVGTTDVQTLTNKTLTVPTIASFLNAEHGHTTAAGGGTLDAAAIGTGTVAPARLGSGSGGTTKFLREDSTFQTIPGGGDALTSGSLAQFAATTSAQLAGVLSDETGSGSAVFATSPTLVTPALGTPSSAVLTNATGLPVGALVGAVAIANGGTGQTGQTAAFDALSPTTTKGDIPVDNGTNVVRLPVGATTGHVLTVDPAEATGVKWAAAAAGTGDVTGPVSSTAGNVPTYADTSGDVLDAGFPVSAAAKTVLDDASVSAMVDTLGGASATGSGGLVRATSPSLTTPTLGVATATSVNKVAVTAPATSATLTIADGATLTASATASVSGTNSGDVALAGTPDYITISGQTITRGAIDLGTDTTGTLAIASGGTGQTGQTAAFNALSPSTTKGDLLLDNGTDVVRLGVGSDGQILTADSVQATGVKWATAVGGGNAQTADPLSQFAPTTSAQLAGVITDEIGTGALVFANTPTLVTPVLGVATATSINKVAVTAPATSATLTIADGATLTASATATVSGTNTGDQTISLTGDVTGSGTGSFAATIASSAVTFAKMQAVSANVLLGNDATGTAVEEIACTAAGRALIDDADATAQRATLGLGALATLATVGTTQIDNSAVTLAKMADMATDSFIGRDTAGTGAPEVLSASTARTILNVADGATANPDALETSVSGEIAALTEKVAPVSGDHLLIEDSAAANVKKRVQVGNLPAGTPAADSITNTILANMAAQSVKANPTGSSADPQDLAVAEQRIVGRITGGNVTGLTGAQVVTLTGAEVTPNKDIASGYAGLDALIQVPTARQRPRAWDQIEYGWRKTPGLATVEPLGHAYPYEFVGELTDAPGNGGSWVLVDSATDGHGGLLTAFNVIQSRWSPDLHFSIKTGASLTGHRFWIGVVASFIDDTAPVADGGTFSIASAGFTWDATVHSGSNFWRAHTSDGSGAAGATVTTAATAIAVDTEYDLRIKFNPGTNVLFYINDTLVATHTTDLPSVATVYGICMRVIGTDKTMLFKRALVLHD